MPVTMKSQELALLSYTLGNLAAVTMRSSGKSEDQCN